VEQFLDSITREQFERWAEFDDLHPIGLGKLYEILSIGFATVSNMLSKDKPFEPWMFIPGANKPEVQQDPRMQRAIVRQIAELHNASINLGHRR